MFISTAHAAAVSWTEKGNGGDIVVCPNSSQNKMYDAYETEVRHGLRLVLPSAPESEAINDATYTGFEDLDESLKVAATILNRVRGQDQELYAKFLERHTKFKKQVRFLANTDLINIDDGGIVFLPRGCELKQLIVQRQPKFPADRLYTVALDYWKTLSIQQKAVAIVHEVLYNEVLSASRAVKTSESVRYFNALLLSDTLKSLNGDEYKILKYQVFYWD